MERDTPHGWVRIHGREGDEEFCATFVRKADEAVVLLASGDYVRCAGACIGALSCVDAVWDGDQFPPPAVIYRSRRRFFTPVQGRSVVGALEIFGGVVILGVENGVWSFLFHDGRRSEWLAPSSSTFDLDAWLRDHPASTAPEPSPSPAPAPPASPPTSSPTPETAPPPPAPPPSPQAAPPGANESLPTASERRRQAQAAHKDAEQREQQRQAAEKDARLRDRQRQVVVGPDPDPEDDGPSDSDTARVCLLRLPDRAPAGKPQLVVGWFVTLVLALGEIGYFGDLSGRKADIAATLSQILGMPVCAKMLGLALTILYKMGCCLVDLVNAKWWTVKLDGLGKRTTPLHQELLAETPAGFQLQPAKVAFRGRRPVRWEVPRTAATGGARPYAAPSTASADQTAPSHAPAAEASSRPDAPSTATPPETASAADPPAGVGDADLRHQLTVAHGLIKLAHQRHADERVEWQRDKAALEQRVAAADGRVQATAAELAGLREQHDAVLAKLAAIEQTAERTGAALADKLERATAALVAATDHLEVERQQRAAEVERHALEVAHLISLAEESRRRELDMTAERDRYAAEAARLAHFADDQRRRELELEAERDRDPDEGTHAQLVADPDHPAPQIDGRDRQVAIVDPRPATVSISSIVVTCVTWTVATVTFTAARRARAWPDLAHGTAACTSSAGGRDARPTPACFPWIGPVVSTSELGAQGPRGPPTSGG